ncbi:Leucine-rich repeat domain superfamily [Sesbania bispinosa]|nr:Leucine-rich repeat domain superfamily [Sesbania bispinosa]
MISTEGSVCLPSLEELHVENCEELVEIVAKDGAAIEEANKELIIFPSLSSLKLWNLPRLRCIYPGMRILEWPMLKVLNVIHCQMLKIFATEFQNSPVSYSEGEDSFPTDQQSFVSLEKVAPKLEVLSLSKQEAWMIEQGKLHVDLEELVLLILQGFTDESDDVFSFIIHSKVPLPRIAKLEVVHSAFKEIFLSQTPTDYDKMGNFLLQLERLELRNLSQLKSIGLEHSWVGPLLKNLKALYVCACNYLTNLTPSMVSFSNLIELNVNDCHGLKYLFPFSTAKTLHALKEMHLTNCHSIEEIVLGEDHEAGEDDEMIFKQLETLALSSLPKLGSFYSGSSTLKFPSLKQVLFSQCYSTKVFRLGDIVPAEDLKVTIDGVCWEGDINDVIVQQFDLRRRQPDMYFHGT